MNHLYKLAARLLSSALVCFCPFVASAQSFQSDVTALVTASCIDCHNRDTQTDLDFSSLGHDLADKEVFGKWENVFDRVRAGEMPPASEERPNKKLLDAAFGSLKADLHSASAQLQQRVGRVPARRLTKLEFGNTLRDLLLIQSDVTSGIPDEVDAGSFDTVGAAQRISAVHMESYLKAADEALEIAIQRGKNPYRSKETDFRFLDQWHEKPLNLGGSITRKLKFGNGIALFRDVDYLTSYQFDIRHAGIHRLTTEVAAYQSDSPVTAKFIVKNQAGNARLVKSIDLMPSEPETIVIDTFMQPGEKAYVTFDQEGVESFAELAKGSANYKGRGLAILSQTAEGPIFDTWPPKSTRQLLGDSEADNKKEKIVHVAKIIRRIAPRVFRRRVKENELIGFIDLAKPAIDDGRDLPDIVQISLRSMISSPQFLLFDEAPGKLNDYALANRLSYFLWKTMPDEELFVLARSGKLSERHTMRAQTERMLADDRSNQFVSDFVGQWLRLNKINATSPDDGLYPEYDELLGDAMPKETELFFAELLHKNLSLTNLIDSDFTFLNRRLAKHYGILGVRGQEFRKVQLRDDSHRGGVLTQAAILKTSANGTTTSPVTRGNFVLTNFLGTPPSPPPPDIGSIEPDTRGKTTIREILASHRDNATCNQCHKEIDPPGFALESFDPIGGYRHHYRASGGEREFGGFMVKMPPKQGPPVDSSGVTSDGKTFAGIDEFKEILMDQKQQVATNFVSQLVVYCTGGEIQFADRNEIDAIVRRTEKDNYAVKDIVHAVIQSKMFRNR